MSLAMAVQADHLIAREPLACRVMGFHNLELRRSLVAVQAVAVVEADARGDWLLVGLSPNIGTFNMMNRKYGIQPGTTRIRQGSDTTSVRTAKLVSMTGHRGSICVATRLLVTLILY